MNEQKKYVHLSLDCWGTLINPHPEHSKERNRLISQVLLPEIRYTAPQKEIDGLIKRAKRFADYSNEALGEQLSQRQALIMCIIDDYETIPKSVWKARFVQFDIKYQELIKALPPQLYSDETLDLLKYLKSKDIKMNISCNTSFIKGISIREFFVDNNIGNYFWYQLYSDEINGSKPSEFVFRNIYKPWEDTLHIGDNLFSDGGSEQIGIKFLHINGDSGKTISEVLKYI